MIKITRILLCNTLFIAPIAMSADDENVDLYPHLFVGAKAGIVFSQKDDRGIELAQDYLVGGVVGSQLTKNWSWDLTYQYHGGADQESAESSVGIFSSGFRYDWYLSERLSIYSRVAAAYWQVEKANVGSSIDENGFSPSIGAGVSYLFTPKLYLSAGVEHINSIAGDLATKYDSNTAFLGLTYHFHEASSADKIMPAPVVPAASAEGQVSPQQEPNIFETTIKGNVGFAFASDSFTLTPSLKTQLDEIITVLERYPMAHVELIGHTDSTGTEEYNYKLSKLRAQSLLNTLRLNGADVTRIKVTAKGESEPISENTTKAGRAKNRRVELVILGFEY